MTPGTSPLRRVARAAPLPARSRSCTCNELVVGIGISPLVTMAYQSPKALAAGAASRGAAAVPTAAAGTRAVYTVSPWKARRGRGQRARKLLREQVGNRAFAADALDGFGHEGGNGDLADVVGQAHGFRGLDAVGDDKFLQGRG